MGFPIANPFRKVNLPVNIEPPSIGLKVDEVKVETNSKLKEVVFPILQKLGIMKKDSPPIKETHAIDINNPVEVFKKAMEVSETATEKEIKEHKKAVTILKVKKVATVVLIGLGAVLVTAGIGAACVFCPPAGAAALAVTFAVLGTGAVFGTLLFPKTKPEITPENLEKIENKAKNLQEALELFKNHPKPKKGEVDNSEEDNSFESFLETNFRLEKNKESEVPKYNMDNLDKYVAAFKTKTNLKKDEGTITTKKLEQTTLTTEITALKNTLRTTLEETYGQIETKKNEIKHLEETKLTSVFEDTKAEGKSEIAVKEGEINGFINEKDFAEGVKQGVKQNMDLLKQKEKELSKLSNEIKDLENNFIENTNAHKRNLVKIAKSSYSGDDQRITASNLVDWKSKRTLTPEVTVSPTKLGGHPDNEPIFFFGNFSKAEIRTPYKERDANYKGEIVNNTASIKGKVATFNYLSNLHDHDEEIKIGEKTYPSVAHYLINLHLNALEKDLNVLEVDESKQEKLQNIHKVRKDINVKGVSAKDAMKIFTQDKEVQFRVSDTELKTALYHKFVGVDGKPNDLGNKLIATGDIQLYAGHEPGDPSYGVKFDNQTQMIGSNKLGVFLMELRTILQAIPPAAPPPPAPIV